jgi:hypothetical protein
VALGGDAGIRRFVRTSASGRTAVLRPASVRPAVLRAAVLRAVVVRAVVLARVVERLLELRLVEPGRIERPAPATVREREPSSAPDVVLGDVVVAVEGGERPARPRRDDVGPQPVDAEPRAQAADEPQLPLGEADRR